MITAIESFRAGLFDRKHWLSNIVAGLIVGVVALPLAMAFAIASGAKPEQGIYTSIIAGLAVSLFGGSRLQIAGPTGAFIVILSGVTGKFGIDGLLVATFMAGIMLVGFGLARFGGVIRYIPAPVIVGFTAGIGVIIWVGEWRDFFGLPKVGGEQFYQKTWNLLAALPDLHPATALLGALSLLLVIVGPRLPGLKRIPGPLIAMLAATLIQSVFSFPGVATLGSAFGGIPQGLPSISIPAMTFDRVVLLLPSAFTIAMLGAIESLLSAVVADGMGGTRHNSNQELIGQGIANILSPLFGGIAATGAIARTATNVRNGATGPLAGVVHALTLVLVLLVLAPLASTIPLCSLAAILFVVAWNMSDAHGFVRMARTAPRADVVILVLTFALTILTDLVIAVNIGVVLAMLQFVRRMAASVEVRPVADDEPVLEAALRAWPALPREVQVLTIVGPFFFGGVDSLDQAIGNGIIAPRFLVIRLQQVPFMDMTGLQALEEMIVKQDAAGTQVCFCEANQRVLRKLRRTGLVVRDGPRQYFGTLAAALAYCREQSGPKV